LLRHRRQQLTLNRRRPFAEAVLSRAASIFSASRRGLSPS
jgi:hypothetical protein